MKSGEWPEQYRGFRLAWQEGLHGYKAMWRSSLESMWTVGCVYVDEKEETLQLAKECIDFNYRKEAAEAELGRRLTLQEICAMGEVKHGQ